MAMGGLAKLTLSLGNKVFAAVALIVSCLAVVAGFLGLQQLSEQQHQSLQVSHQKQLAAQLFTLTSSKVESLERQMASIASSPKIVSLLMNNDARQIEIQEKELASLFPNALKTCLISADVDDVDLNACIPISFATLNSLRQAKKDGIAPTGLMKRGTDKAHLLMAHRVINNAETVVGVLVVTLKPNVVQGLLDNAADFQGYIELQQGTKKVAVLTSQGDASQKQGNASFIQQIPNTYWKTAYWPQETSHTSAFSMVGLGIVIAIIILMWFLREGIRIFLFKRDVVTLRAQLVDLKSGALKPNYPLSFRALTPIENDIQALGRENYKASVNARVKAGATAESIGKKVLETENPSELEMLHEIIDIDPSIFKANDIRGIVGQNLNEEIITVIGQAIGSEAGEQGISRLVVGRDGRLSSTSLSDALVEGILASGCDVLNIGEVPTPLMYFACEKMGTHSGVMVTGSHNPTQYNGLKTLLAGQILSGDKLQTIYQRVQQTNFRTGEGVLSEANIVSDYIERITSDVNVTRPIKIVIDCGNGVAGAVAPTLFKALGCEVIELYCDVDGSFPNHHPNPSIPENLHDLTEAVQKHGAELGLAFDGDGDRLGVVDGYGAPIWPDRLMMLFSQDVLSRIPGSVIVYDVKCTNLLGEEIAKAGGEAIMTKSGYSFIKQEMQKREAQLAGEMSGHIFFKERWYGFDDGLYAAARLLELLSEDPMQRRATEVFSALPNREGTAEILVEMNEGECIPFIRQLSGEGRFDGADIITIDGLRAEYPNGWGLVRASNTTPGLTLRFEADTVDELHDIKQIFKQQMLQIKPTLILLF